MTIRNIRTVLAMPFVGVFYGLIYLTGVVAVWANIVAGEDGIIAYRPVNESSGDDLFTVGDGENFS